MSKAAFASVCRFVADKFGYPPDHVTLETRFADLADSLELVELTMDMENYFNVCIPDEDAEHLHTVGDAVAFIAKQRHSA